VKDPRKFTQIGIFGLKTQHLATLERSRIRLLTILIHAGIIFRFSEPRKKCCASETDD
jgi:hypothetical protein